MEEVMLKTKKTSFSGMNFVRYIPNTVKNTDQIMIFLFKLNKHLTNYAIYSLDEMLYKTNLKL